MKYLKDSQTYDICPNCGSTPTDWSPLGHTFGSETVTAKWQCNCGTFFEQQYNLGGCCTLTEEEAIAS